MSKLNDIHSSYGKSFGIAVANTYSYTVLNATALPKNTVIVSSSEDGKASLLVTDNFGTAARLTYNILDGNGLRYENGALSLETSGRLVENANGELSANISSLVDNSTMQVVAGKMSVSTQSIAKASKTQYGVMKVDGTTIVSDNGTLRVDTTKLDLANNSSGTFGTIRGNGAVKAVNGVLSVDTTKLDKASGTTYGIAKPDNSTIVASNGTLGVNINSFQNASSTSWGICKPDDNSIYKTNQNALRINYNALKKASSNSFGMFKADNSSTVVENGVLSIKDYSTIQQTVIGLSNSIVELDDRISSIESSLGLLEPTTNGPKIYTLVCDGLASVDLVKPEFGETPENMLVQKISATFIVKTNCPFKIAMHYLDNVSPAISLFEINYNDIDHYPGDTGLNRTYQSTQEKNAKITFSWLCKNYRNSDNKNYSTKTKVFIDVVYANDIEISKEVKYSIVRFNSLYDESAIEGGDNTEVLIDNTGSAHLMPIVSHRLVLDTPEFGDAGDEDDTTFNFKDNQGEVLYNRHYTATQLGSDALPWLNEGETVTGYSISGDNTYDFNSSSPKLAFNVTLDDDTEQFYRYLENEDLANVNVKFSYIDNGIVSYANNVTLKINDDNVIYMSYTF